MCFEASCSEPTGDKRCARCQSASYCSRSCQEKDWSRHRLWCRASKSARQCPRCVEFPTSIIVLHGDDVKSKCEDVKVGATPFDFHPSELYPVKEHPRVVWMYHAPFSPHAKSIQESELGTFNDTLFVSCGTLERIFRKGEPCENFRCAK